MNLKLRYAISAFMLISGLVLFSLLLLQPVLPFDITNGLDLKAYLLMVMAVFFIIFGFKLSIISKSPRTKILKELLTQDEQFHVECLLRRGSLLVSHKALDPEEKREVSEGLKTLKKLFYGS